MKKALFIICILLSFNLQIGFCATDEGYGEAETALGQFVDSFENDNNVSVAIDVIQNATLDCMELNYTIGTSLLENYTDYTEVDPANRITIHNDTHIEHQAKRNEDSYLYYDYGAGYFTDFIHTLKAKTTFPQNSHVNSIWGVADAVDDMKGIWDDGDIGLSLRFYSTVGVGNRIYILEFENGNAFFDFSGGYLANTYYYFNISKQGTVFTVQIYSDEAMMVLLDTLLINLQADHNFRYVYGCNSYNSAEDISGNATMHNLNIGRLTGGFDPDGYFTTDDYMNDTNCNGTTLALMVNTSIPANTDIQVQFSNDNATWGDWEGIPLDSNILSGGFETIDLRYLNETNCYLRFNLSTTDSSVTPRVYQARIISTIGNQTGGAALGPSGGGIGWMMLFLIGVPLIVIIVWGNRRR